MVRFLLKYLYCQHESFFLCFTKNLVQSINIILIQGGKLGLKEDRFDVPFVFEGGKLTTELLRWGCQALKKMRTLIEYFPVEN